MLKKILGCINKCVTCIVVLLPLEVGKLNRFPARKYTDKVRIGRDLERMSWEKVEENRKVNLRKCKP